MQRFSARIPLIDTLKALASQVIVLHHVVSYGPVARSLAALLPQTATWLFEYGRMAVQIFLVVSGFLAARSFSSARQMSAQTFGQLLWRRYLRLVRPFAVAVLCAIAASAMARVLWQDEAIPAWPSLLQFFAHLFLLHGVLDVDSLSAGVWYVAIDFQLYALMAMLFFVCSGRPDRALALTMLLAAVSLLGFNRNPDWDAWGLYFFGSYGLGALAFRVSAPGVERLQRMAMLAGAAIVVGVALWMDFRLRIALAASVALLLATVQYRGGLDRLLDIRLMAWLGKISYSLFLIHFPILLLVNAVCSRIGTLDAAQTFVAVLAIWLGSLGAGALLYRHVEAR